MTKTKTKRSRFASASEEFDRADAIKGRLDGLDGAKPERQRLTSVAIPPELLAEIRTEVARRSNEEGRRIGAWELIAEAWNARPTR